MGLSPFPSSAWTPFLLAGGRALVPGGMECPDLIPPVQLRAFHAMWLNQLEQGRVTWEDEEAKLKFTWALIWYPATTGMLAATISDPLPQKKQP